MTETKEYWKYGYTFFHDSNHKFGAVYFDGVLEAEGAYADMVAHLGADIHQANNVTNRHYADDYRGVAFGTVAEVVANIGYEEERESEYIRLSEEIAQSNLKLKKLTTERDKIYPRGGDVF